MYKRAGRAHDSGGIASTPEGGAAMECPACPRPDWHIPDSWISSPLEWLYQRYLAIDANFRLSNRFSRSTEKSDPCLNDGRAYMISAVQFEAYLKELDKDKDGNDIEQINPIFSVLFDAAQVVLEKTRTFVVPNFHLYAHKFWCFCRHNFLYTPGVAQTDGEGCERVWAGTNGAQGSIRESGVGAWRDMMDDICQAWNQKKACGLGTYNDYEEHKRGASIGVHALQDILDLTALVINDTHDKYKKFSKRLERWDADGQKGKDCPYEHTLPTLPELTRRAESEVDLVTAPKRAQRSEEILLAPHTSASAISPATGTLADKDPVQAEGAGASADLAQGMGAGGVGATSGETATASTWAREPHDRRLSFEREALLQELADVEANEERVKWLMLGMKLEDDRQRLKSDAPNDSPDVKASREDALYEALLRFRKEQDRHMPGFLVTLPTEWRDPREEDATKTPLSMLRRGRWVEKLGALSIWEMRVRLANMDGLLDELRLSLRLRVALNKQGALLVDGRWVVSDDAGGRYCGDVGGRPYSRGRGKTRSPCTSPATLFASMGFLMHCTSER
ncbi:unnamed protein product [Peniophora sp. CBMAI 1063]|nr:unnamed protein product [Peniophora sp. CBMAI 1063]